MPSSRCVIPDGNKSSNNWLRGLSVDGYSLTPTFAADTTDYSLIVDNDVTGIDVSASAADTNASVSGRGSHELSVGDNKINIIVTAEDGTTKTYTISVVRKKAENPEPVKPDNGNNNNNNGSGENDGFSSNLNVDNDNGIVTESELEAVLRVYLTELLTLMAATESFLTALAVSVLQMTQWQQAISLLYIRRTEVYMPSMMLLYMAM